MKLRLRGYFFAVNWVAGLFFGFPGKGLGAGDYMGDVVIGGKIFLVDLFPFRISGVPSFDLLPLFIAPLLLFLAFAECGAPRRGHLSSGTNISIDSLLKQHT